MDNRSKNIENALKPYITRKELPKFSIIIPILIYGLLYFCTFVTANSENVIKIGNEYLPLNTFAGIFSMLSSILLVVMVLYYKKIGFIVSLTLLLIQFPRIVFSVLFNGNVVGASGLFASLFSILMITIIYLNHSKMIKEHKRMQSLFEQTATALVNAIDAKDTYTHGHSTRVAEYSRLLAEMNHKTEQECDQVYYAALLHDVGKIGVPENIITKKGKLSSDEYEKVKMHPALGSQILKSIGEFPYLSIGAIGHHERYDGKGYPFRLKGTDIPEIARIISVADAYDAMSSKRSYRDPIPQQIVREELVKGMGTQFDPEYARLMIHLIDIDTEYRMRERAEVSKLVGTNEFVIEKYRSEVSKGVLITPFMTTVSITVTPTGKPSGMHPSIILFDSLDGLIHDNEKEIADLNYFEYGEIWFDGKTHTGGARKIESQTVKEASQDIADENSYRLEAVKYKDHALVRIIGKNRRTQTIIALPDSSRYLYISLTGEHCRITDIKTEKAQKQIASDYIPRIAEEISFIDAPAGDMPNVQVDGYRTDASEGIEVKDGLTISFHAKALPTARLVWHCPFIDLFSADDAKVNGKDYRDYAFMRLDGEFWECDAACTAVIKVTRDDRFESWEAWKDFNSNGYDVTVTFKVNENKITMTTENSGIAIKATAILSEASGKIYAAVTGDQVAITNIRVNQK